MCNNYVQTSTEQEVPGGPLLWELEKVGRKCIGIEENSFCWIYLWSNPCSMLYGPSSFLSEGLPSRLGTPLQYNWLWQPHTWQQWGRWWGSFEHCCVVLQRGDRTRAGGCESPRACDWWYGSVSEPICHICPCHIASVRWLLWPHEEHT